MTAYFLGTFISESVPNYIKRHLRIRWDTLLLLIEMLTVIFLALLPESAPHRVTHILINLVASMQYNTFRQTQHIPMATTFCTNHLRQVGLQPVRRCATGIEALSNVCWLIAVCCLLLWQAEQQRPCCAGISWGRRFCSRCFLWGICLWTCLWRIFTRGKTALPANRRDIENGLIL